MKDSLRSLRLWLRPGDPRGGSLFSLSSSWSWTVLCGVIALAGIGGFWAWRASTAVATAPFSTVASALDARQVREVVVDRGGTRLLVTLAAPVTVGDRRTDVVSTELPRGALTLETLERWTAEGATVRITGGEPSGNTVQHALTIILLALIIFAVFRVYRSQFAARRFRIAPDNRQLTLSDVGGAQEAQADLRDVIAFLKEPTRFQEMGARCPTGVLLVGPPGTGKTLLARAVAGESGRPVIIASGSEFSEMYVGVGARRIRDLVRQAREQAPCIVFIDEFDSLGGRRGRPNRSSEEENTLNQLLVEMDGLSGSEGVVWMAATNREDMLDPAVRRPGRFDRVVEVGMPTAADRLAILKIHAANRPLSPRVDLQRLAALTVGYSGADLANLLNEATIFAVQAGEREVTAAHVEQARDKIMLGRLRAGVVVPESERRVIALHEAGHAITGLVACPQDRLHKVTIEPRGRSLGAAHFAPDTERHLYSRSYLEGVLVKSLGGRAAETAFLGQDAVTSGAGADLVQATRIARRMVAELGMSEEVGLLSASPAAQDGGPSAQLQGQIDLAVRLLLQAQMQRAEEIVRRYEGAVKALAEALLQNEVLDEQEVIALAKLHGISVEAPPPDALVAA